MQTSFLEFNSTHISTNIYFNWFDYIHYLENQKAFEKFHYTSLPFVLYACLLVIHNQFSTKKYPRKN